ncbi:MAG: hypothetical protein EBU90_18355 [Proteobacteria bacterium]|nr:hypothetical protein [Pseudomonadota bacterium]NBP13034.1 hypothetical protein [bacterium]
MGTRITPKWTETTKAAFGDTVETQKGLRAEKLILEYLESVYDEVTWYENNREKQVAGIDFEFKKNEWANYYTADVKGNLNRGYFYVYPEEMKKKKNHRMIHVDVNTGYAIEYDRSSMVRFAEKQMDFPLMAGRVDRNGKKFLKLDVWTVKNSNAVDHFRRFRLKNFKPSKEYITKVIDKYEIPGI